MAKYMRICMWLGLIGMSGACNLDIWPQANRNYGVFHEEIDTHNDPNRIMSSLDLVATFDDVRLLASATAHKIPYPANWWSMRGDGINRRWDAGALSPTEKYDSAFLAWVPSQEFADLRPFRAPGEAFDTAYYEQLGPSASEESRYSGNWRVRNGSDDDADGLIDEGDDWDGIEGWYGHCNGWAAASIMVNEPLHPVVVNGTRFEISDIKALLSDAWYSTTNVTLARRCHLQDGDATDVDATYRWTTDEDGRIVEAECRDSNAASLYLVATNLIGRHGRSFIVDTATDSQVWNWPVYAYEIHEQRRVSKAEANALLGDQGESYKYNANAVGFAYVNMSIRFVSDGVAPHKRPMAHKTESYSHQQRYTFVLELDAADQIIGGEWSGDSKLEHPDFMWVPTGTRPLGSNQALQYDDIENLLMRSRSGLAEWRGAVPIAVGDSIGASAVVSVADAENGCNRVQVYVELDHERVSDLTLDLIAPNGRTSRLRQAGSHGWNGLRGWYPYDYIAVDDIDALVAGDGNGTWQLRVANLGDQAGVLRAFSVSVWADGLGVVDRDDDGDPDSSDCAPDDARVHHGAEEICDDGLDNDCLDGDQLCDDHGNTAAAATLLVPGSVDGVVERGGDVDFFTLQTQTGASYVIRTVLGTLPDTVLTLYASDGTQLARNDDDSSSYASRVSWTNGLAQKVVFEVRAYSSTQVGSYHVVVEETLDGGAGDRDEDGDPDTSDCQPDNAAIHHAAVEICDDGLDNDCVDGDAACDDHGNSAQSATPIGLDTAQPGTIESSGDIDFFVLDAAAGQSYQVTISLLSLGDSYLEVFASDMSTRLAFNDDYQGSYASGLSFVASSAGLYYIKVRGYSSRHVGGYTVTATVVGTPITPTDDHGDDVEHPTLLTRDPLLNARIDSEGDVDVFAFEAVQGEAFSVRTVLGSLGDTVLQLRATDGTTVLSENDDADGGLASRIVFTPTASSRVFVFVRAYQTNQTGSYQVHIQ